MTTQDLYDIDGEYNQYDWYDEKCYYRNKYEIVNNLHILKPLTSEKTLWAHAKLLGALLNSNVVGTEFITNPDIGEIIKYVKNIPNLNTRANTACAISLLYQTYPSSSLNINVVYEMRELITTTKIAIDLESDKNKKTEVQEQNWVSHKQIQTLIKKQIEVSIEIMNNGFSGKKSTVKQVQSCIIQCLYMLDPENPPVRCDYCMKVLYGTQRISAFCGSNEKQNYLLVNSNSMTFVFNTYKTKKYYGRKIFRVGDQLYPILKLWLKYKSNPVDLLENTRNAPLNPNNLGKYISDAFAPLNKKLTVDTLRHIFISDRVNLGNSKKYAQLMMHSRSEQSVYWKNQD
tara:strand:- start:2916 stop:3947 length:1032 start_codon:yes stop_codon:yes gene_type:complete